MNAEVINKKALNLLMNQNWSEAQRLFFQNARKNPSYQTYNNLGNYLIDEGFLYTNGRVRNAQKSGLKYLFRALEIKTSSITLYAIAKAYNYQLRTASSIQKQVLHKCIYLCLEKALSIEYSDQIKYNLLRISCLMNIRDKHALHEIRLLIKRYACEESVSLYFQLLYVHSLFDEGLHCIKRYREYLTEIDLLMFYAKYALYEEGYNLCETICDRFSPDKYTASAIIECCVNTNHFEFAKIYAQHIRELENDISYIRKEKWCEKVFDNIDISDRFRKELIAEYISIPPFVESCCYFGCAIHGNSWGDQEDSRTEEEHLS